MECYGRRLGGSGYVEVVVPVSMASASVAVSPGAGHYAGRVVVSPPPGASFDSSQRGVTLACARNGGMWVASHVVSASQLTVVLASATPSPEQPYSVCVVCRMAA